VRPQCYENQVKARRRRSRFGSAGVDMLPAPLPNVEVTRLRCAPREESILGRRRTSEWGAGNVTVVKSHPLAGTDVGRNKPAVQSCLPASTQQKATATLGCAAKIEANVSSQLGGRVQSSSVIAIIGPLLSLRPALARALCRSSRLSGTLGADRQRTALAPPVSG
jgi:hypothetical protein